MPTPNTISNHFTLTALQNGLTIQGSLRVAGTLSQNYSAGTGKCIPDWYTTPAKRPKLYPVIRKGGVYIGAAAIHAGKWFYNDAEIIFDSETHRSTNFKDAANHPLFEEGTMTVSLAGDSYTVPCLTIISNLASPTNLDVDTIGYEGQVELNGKFVDFPRCSLDVKIAQMTTQGYLGLLSPESAIISAKSGAGSSVTIDAELYGEDGQAVTTYYVKFFNAGTGQQITVASGAKSVTVTEADVTDNMIIRCDFFLDSAMQNRVTSAFASIDDTTDPEYLYVSFNGSYGDNSGQLDSGETCTVTMWVATMEDPTAINTAYTNFTVQFYDGNQQEITTGLPTITVANNKATMDVTYQFIAANGYKINGIVTAQ